MVPYFLWVKQSTALCVIGGFFLIKALIEVWGQQTPTWICPGSVCMLLVIYIGIIPTVAYMYGYCTMASDINFKGRDIVGMTLYFGGSFFSLAYEVGRFQWKARPENKGKLHTVGLAAWCIHPNYLGDLFTYTGWALACGTSCAVSIPIFMVWTFMFAVVPNSDNYLAQRYPLEFPAYAEKTLQLSFQDFIPKLSARFLARFACSFRCTAGASPVLHHVDTRGRCCLYKCPKWPSSKLCQRPWDCHTRDIRHIIAYQTVKKWP